MKIDIKIDLNSLDTKTKEKLLSALYQIEDRENYGNHSTSKAIDLLQEHLYGGKDYENIKNNWKNNFS